MSFSRQMEGNLDQGIELMANYLADPVLPDNIRARLWAYLCLQYFSDAETSGVLRSGRECLRLNGPDRFAHTKSLVRYLMGSVHYLRNEFDQAKSYAQGVLDDRAASNPGHVADAACIIAFIHLAEGRPQEAERVVDLLGGEDHEWETPNPHARTIGDSLKAELALRQGKTDEARRLSMDLDFNIRPLVWFFDLPQLTPIRLLLAEGAKQGLEKARIRLCELEEHTGRLNRKNIRIDVLALLALVLQKQAREPEALERLRSALALAEPGGWVRNFTDLGAPMTRLLERLNQVQPEHAYGRRVLAACGGEQRGCLLSSSTDEKGAVACKQTPDLILTQRETELLSSLAEGFSNKEIATKLHISVETVKKHLQNIYGKLNAKGRFAALKKAREAGIFPPR